MYGVEIRGVALASNERLQVPSGEGILKVLPDGAIENTGLPLSRALSALSIMIATLSLSMTFWSSTFCSSGGLDFRPDRAASPRESSASGAHTSGGRQSRNVA